MTLSVSGLPPGATATIAPNTIPAGSPVTNVSLIIQLPQTTAKLLEPHIPPIAWCVLLLPFAPRLRRAGKRISRTWSGLLLAALALAVGVGVRNCGSTSSGFFGHPPTDLFRSHQRDLGVNIALDHRRPHRSVTKGMTMPGTFRHIVLFLETLTSLTGLAQQRPVKPTPAEIDVAITYVAERAKIASIDCRCFWLEGGGMNAAVAFHRGLGVAANLTGGHASNIESGVDLNKVSFMTGPRYTIHSKTRLATTLAGLAQVAFV